MLQHVICALEKPFPQEPFLLLLFKPNYDSTVTLAFGFVTFTPNAFALAMISILFLEDTACDILLYRSKSNQSPFLFPQTVLQNSSLKTSVPLLPVEEKGGGKRRRIKERV